MQNNPGISSLGQLHERALPVQFLGHRKPLMTTCGTRMSSASSIHASCRFGHDSNALFATNSNCRNGDRLKWEMLAIWVFVVFNFAALVFAGYVIWAKC